MATTKHNSPLAITYAQSLLELANEQNAQPVEIGRELEGLGDILEANPVFKEYLADPGISHVERSLAVERIFKGRVSPLLYNFLAVMSAHGRLRVLGEVVAAYRDLLDEQLGNVEVDVTTARQLSPDELEQVRNRINTVLSKNTVIHQYVDDSIIGGLIIRVGDQVIDASVQQQLRSMRQQLLGAARKIR